MVVLRLAPGRLYRASPSTAPVRISVLAAGHLRKSLTSSLRRIRWPGRDKLAGGQGCVDPRRACEDRRRPAHALPACVSRLTGCVVSARFGFRVGAEHLRIAEIAKRAGISEMGVRLRVKRGVRGAALCAPRHATQRAVAGQGSPVRCGRRAASHGARHRARVRRVEGDHPQSTREGLAGSRPAQSRAHDAHGSRRGGGAHRAMREPPRDHAHRSDRACGRRPGSRGRRAPPVR